MKLFRVTGQNLGRKLLPNFDGASLDQINESDEAGTTFWTYTFMMVVQESVSIKQQL
jgi:hypothetical protein